MWLLYLDESGSPDTKDSQYFVVGGVAAFARQVYWLNQEVESVNQKYLPDATVEFHASEIAQHRAEPWHSMAADVRNQVTNSVYEVLARQRPGVTLFAAAIQKSFTPDPVSRAFEEICRRFDQDEQVLHGLLHCCADASSCLCPACLTRRLSRPKQPAETPAQPDASRPDVEDEDV